MPIFIRNDDSVVDVTDSEIGMLTNAQLVRGSDISNMQQGDSSNNILMGTHGSDLIDAAGGNDWICGGKGNDFISSGAGNDTLIWRAEHLDGQDRIADFDAEHDKLRFEGIFDPSARGESILTRLSLSVHPYENTAERLDGSETGVTVIFGTKSTLSILSEDADSVLHQIHLLRTDYTEGGTLSNDAALRHLLEQGAFEFA